VRIFVRAHCAECHTYSSTTDLRDDARARYAPRPRGTDIVNVHNGTLEEIDVIRVSAGGFHLSHVGIDLPGILG